MDYNLPPLAEDTPFLIRYPSGNSQYHPSVNLLELGHGRTNPHATLHELVHVMEHYSTPYGVFLDEMHHRQLLLSQEMLKDYAGSLFVSVYRWADGARKSQLPLPPGMSRADFDRLFERYIRPWSIYVHVLQTMMGINARTVRSAVADEESRLLDTCETPISEQLIPSPDQRPRRPFDYIPTLARSPEHLPACPECTWVGERETTAFPIGKLHVAETIAQFQEGLDRCFDSENESKYLALAGMAINSLGVSKRDRAPVHLFTTCLTIADLALFSPLGSLYGRLRSPEMRWQDVHPGYRFQIALTMVERADAWIADFAQAEELANFICHECGWVRPRQFLELGASQKHTWLRRHARACTFRLSDFMLFYDLRRVFEHGSDTVKFLSDHMPMIFHPDYGTVCAYPETHTEPTIALEQVRDVYLSRLCWMVMFDGERLMCPILPSGLNLGMYFTNVTTEQEFGALLAANHPWTRTDRFIQLH